MSECVVRMEMPKDCLHCPMVNFDTIGDLQGCEAKPGKCDLQGKEDEFWDLDRPSWCPIVCSLPDGHGRLVDAELLKEILKPVDSISHYEPEWTWGELHESNCVAIDNAPTIVPAEAERSET